MKLNIIALFFIAGLISVCTAFAMQQVISTEPTAVLSVPAENGAKGGGFTMKLPKSFTPKQAELLTKAYEIAKKDGHQHPQILQGIILQETRAGDYHKYKVAGQEYGLKSNHRYYGVGQIKLAAAKDVLARYPSMTREFEFHTMMDEEIIAKLIENDEFNMSVASKYLLIMKSYGYNTIQQLALAYNQGPGGAKSHDPNSHHYPNGVMKYIQALRSK